jgi:hypothetical protein
VKGTKEGDTYREEEKREEDVEECVPGAAANAESVGVSGTKAGDTCTREEEKLEEDVEECVPGIADNAGSAYGSETKEGVSEE